MRLLIVGSDKVYAIENFYARYLPENGWTVKQFPAQSRFYDYYQRGLLPKIFFKAGLSGILRQINREFRELADRFQPDIIWIFKGMEIYPSSIRWAKERGIRLVNYNPDNPFIFSGKGSGNRYLVESLPLYDLHLTYNHEIKVRLEKEYTIKTDILPFGFDLDEQLFRICSAQAEIPRLCFLGNPDQQRAAFLDGMAAAGIPVTVYGNHWQRFLKHPAIEVFGPVYSEEFWKVLRRYRVQLNLMRIHNEDSHNMRSFEVPGVAGIMLAPATSEHRRFFEDGKEAFLFDDLEEAIRMTRMILDLNGEAAGRIRQQARQRALQDGYSYRDRSRDVSGKLLELYQRSLPLARQDYD